jgi:branched-subunit amino acid transport protein AzlD
VRKVYVYDYIDKINLRENYCFKEKETTDGTKKYGSMFVGLTIVLYHFWASLVFNTA